jgi:hypothetical protein
MGQKRKKKKNIKRNLGHRARWFLLNGATETISLVPVIILFAENYDVSLPQQPTSLTLSLPMSQISDI